MSTTADLFERAAERGRPRGAAQVWAAAQRDLHERPSPLVPDPAGADSRSRRAILLVAAVLLVLVALAGVARFVRQERGPAPVVTDQIPAPAAKPSPPSLAPSHRYRLRSLLRADDPGPGSPASFASIARQVTARFDALGAHVDVADGGDGWVVVTTGPELRPEAVRLLLETRGQLSLDVVERQRDGAACHEAPPPIPPPLRRAEGGWPASDATPDCAFTSIGGLLFDLTGSAPGASGPDIVVQPSRDGPSRSDVSFSYDQLPLLRATELEYPVRTCDPDPPCPVGVALSLDGRIIDLRPGPPRRPFPAGVLTAVADQDVPVLVAILKSGAYETPTTFEDLGPAVTGPAHDGTDVRHTSASPPVEAVDPPTAPHVRTCADPASCPSPARITTTTTSLTVADVPMFCAAWARVGVAIRANPGVLYNAEIGAAIDAFAQAAPPDLATDVKWLVDEWRLGSTGSTSRSGADLMQSILNRISPLCPI